MSKQDNQEKIPDKQTNYLSNRIQSNLSMCNPYKINLSNQGIEFLDLVQENFRNITILNLDNNLISNINGIQQFTNLTYLSLKNNRIQDQKNLFILKDMSQLEELDLSNNPIQKFSLSSSILITLLPNLTKINKQKIELSERQKAQIMLDKQSLKLEDLLKNYCDLVTLNSIQQKINLHSDLFRSYDLTSTSQPFSLKTFYSVFQFKLLLDEEIESEMKGNLLQDVYTLQNEYDQQGIPGFDAFKEFQQQQLKKVNSMYTNIEDQIITYKQLRQSKQIDNKVQSKQHVIDIESTPYKEKQEQKGSEKKKVQKYIVSGNKQKQEQSLNNTLDQSVSQYKRQSSPCVNNKYSSRTEKDKIIQDLQITIQNLNTNLQIKQLANRQLSMDIQEIQIQSQQNQEQSNQQISMLKQQQDPILKELQQLQDQRNIMYRTQQENQTLKNHLNSTQNENQTYKQIISNQTKIDEDYKNAVKFNERRIQFDVFYEFIKTVGRQKEIKQYILEKQSMRNRNILIVYFSQLQENTIINKILQQKKIEHSLQYQEEYLIKWKQNINFMKNYQQFQKNKSIQIKQKAFDGFLAYKNQKQINKIKKQNSEFFYQQYLYIKGFRGVIEWKKKYRLDADIEKNLSDKAVLYYRRKLKSTLLSEWKIVVDNELKPNRQNKQLADNFFKLNLLFYSLQAFKINLQMSYQKQIIVDNDLIQKKKIIKEKIFNKLHQRTFIDRKKKLLLNQRVQQYYFNKLMRKSVEGLFVNISVQKLRKEQIQKKIKNKQNKKLFKLILILKSNKNKKKLQKTQNKNSKQHFLQKIFQAWKKLKNKNKKIKINLKNTVHLLDKLIKTNMKNNFNQFKSNIKEILEKKKNFLRVINILNNSYSRQFLNNLKLNQFKALSYDYNCLTLIQNDALEQLEFQKQENEILNQEKIQFQKNICSLKSKNEQILSELDNKEKIIIQNKKEINEHVNQEEKLHQQQQLYLKQINELKLQITKFQDEQETKIQQYNYNIERFKQQQSNMEYQIQNQEAIIEEKTKNQILLKKKLQISEEYKQEQQDNNQILQQQNEKLKRENDQIKTENKQTLDQYHILLSERDICNQKLIECVQLIEDNDKQYESKIKDQSGQIELLNNKQREIQDLNRQLNQQIIELKSQLRKQEYLANNLASIDKQKTEEVQNTPYINSLNLEKQTSQNENSQLQTPMKYQRQTPTNPVFQSLKKEKSEFIQEIKQLLKTPQSEVKLSVKNQIINKIEANQFSLSNAKSQQFIRVPITSPFKKYQPGMIKIGQEKISQSSELIKEMEVNKEARKVIKQQMSDRIKKLLNNNE